MKYLSIFIFAFALLINCNKQTFSNLNKSEYELYGADFKPKKILTENAMLKTYESLAVGDTIQVAFQSKTTKVCTKKGCWMDITLDNQSSFVKFKDYGFFVPINTKEGTEVIVNGKAFVKEISVDELRHYAEDGGATKEEIAKITKPELKFNFLADGVLMKKS